MTLIHRPGITLDGDNRTLLYAYGGFGISLWPGYSERVAAWVRLGGVAYAIASIRAEVGLASNGTTAAPRLAKSRTQPSMTFIASSRMADREWI